MDQKTDKADSGDVFHSSCPPQGHRLCLCPFRDRLSGGTLGGGGGGGGGGADKADSGDVFLYSPLKVVIFVALMCGMLVLMYFFYNVLGE